MNLVADRFVVLDDRRSFDLAGGRRVMLVTSAAGGVAEQTRWVQRCDRFLLLRHRCLARLVDFGVYGEMRRFEAWRCDGPWSGAGAQSEGVRNAAAAFLAASGLSAGALAADHVHACDGRAVLVPDADCGLEVQDVDPAAACSSPCRSDARDLPIRLHGLAIINRRTVASAAELFSEASGARPRSLALWGPPGAGVRTAIQDLSRAARLHGLVPVGTPVLDTRMMKLLYGRSLCLIVRDGMEGWRRLVEWSLHSPRPHVVLFAGHEEVPHVDGVPLGCVTSDALIGAVRPECIAPEVKRRVERAAMLAKGIPGRFVQLLWGEPWDERAPRPGATRTRAAEEPARYGELPADQVAIESVSHGMAPWPAARELAALRRGMDRAAALLDQGRHEPGCRELRQAIGGLARRHDWARAAQGGLLLVRALLKRGRPREAASALADAREHVARTDRSSPLWLEAAVLAGVTSTDLARLDEAETVLHAAVAAARADGDPAQLAAARIALGRCLFWRGRYDEANRALIAVEQMDHEQWPPVTLMHLNMLLSRTAVGRGDLAGAVARATGALAAAERIGQASAIAHAAYILAFAHLAVGDRVALERDVVACVQASRRARDPLRALKARLIGAEHACHTGTPRPAVVFLARIAKIPAANMPATVRARCAVVSELSSGSLSATDILKRQIAATGLEALALFAPGITAIARSTEQAVVNDTLEILRCCQSADDGRTVLIAVAAALRKQLRAAAMSFVSREGHVVAADGARADSTMADRVLAADQVIAPHLCEGTIEGGAPVRYAGEPIAVLIGRWTLGATYDSPRAAMAMALAATAAGPAAAEAIMRAREAPAHALGDILGASPSIAEVRRSVERAASAPFAVLVEGESGSGKELVARALHRHGPRRDRPFCTINCAALPDDLVESELFGHARGAFTGAAIDRPGVFEEAHTGTLFLDEIGELSPRAQAKVLRTIQEGELRRLGENISRRIDVRIVAATNRDLRKESATGRFRADLMYRLDVVRITVPPLRERREDIVPLAERFWQEAAARLGSRAILASATLAALTRYDWPGNVRELQNVLASLAVRSPRRGVVPPTALPPPLSSAAAASGLRLDDARRSFEERFVRAALVRTAGHRMRAAEQLGVTRQGLTKLMTRLGISE